MSSNLTQEPKIRIYRRVKGFANTKRKPIYDALAQLKVGDGMEVNEADFINTYMGCRYAVKNFEQFAGWKIKTYTTEQGKVIKRVN